MGVFARAPEMCIKMKIIRFWIFKFCEKKHFFSQCWKFSVNSLYRLCDDKLKFLYEIGRREQVGMYLRNQNILDESFEEQYKKRAECEKTHGHIKGTVKFDIRRIRNVSKKLYSLLR